MLEPGWPGLRNALQHAVLFHPAFGPGGDQEQEEKEEEVDQQEQKDQQENEDQQEQEDQQEKVDQQETANGNMTTTDTLTKYFIRCLISRRRGGREEVISLKSKMITTLKAKVFFGLTRVIIFAMPFNSV